MIRNLIITIYFFTLFASPVFGMEPDMSELQVDHEACYGGYRPNSTWLKESDVQWEADSKILPLPPSEAIRKAKDEFNKHLKDYMEMKIEAGNVRLHQVEGFWCYTIAISFHRRDINLVGPPLWACVHVRMDGVARVENTPLVTPEPAGLLLDRDKKTSEQRSTLRPATQSESDSNGGVKPVPESKRHSQ